MSIGKVIAGVAVLYVATSCWNRVRKHMAILAKFEEMQQLLVPPLNIVFNSERQDLAKRLNYQIAVYHASDSATMEQVRAIATLYAEVKAWRAVNYSDK